LTRRRCPTDRRACWCADSASRRRGTGRALLGQRQLPSQGLRKPPLREARRAAWCCGWREGRKSRVGRAGLRREFGISAWSFSPSVARGWGTSSRALPARGSDTRRRSTPRLAQDGPGDSLINYTSSEGDAMKDIASKAGLTVWARAASSAPVGVRPASPQWTNAQQPARSRTPRAGGHVHRWRAERALRAQPRRPPPSGGAVGSRRRLIG
jgi:hypothetical protein